MSAMARTGRFNGRYFLTKLGTARDMVLNQMSNPEAAAQGGGLVQMFQEAYKKQLTTIIAVTGAAMAPAINAVSALSSTAGQGGSWQYSSSGGSGSSIVTHACGWLASMCMFGFGCQQSIRNQKMSFSTTQSSIGRAQQKLVPVVRLVQLPDAVLVASCR